MKNYLKVDERNRLLIMDRTFARNCRIFDSDEYQMLQRAKANHKGFAIVLKRIKSNPEKRVYKHLTYEYMQAYIECHANKEARLKEFNEMVLRSKCHAIKYPKVKEWFLAAYPEIDDFTPEQYHNECKANQGNSDCFEIITESDAA